MSRAPKLRYTCVLFTLSNSLCNMKRILRIIKFKQIAIFSFLDTSCTAKRSQSACLI